jgi:TfoX/Sxy family transcriptional regulator of competence genes
LRRARRGATRVDARQWIVAYDERLAARIRSLMAGEPGVVEKAMFGGLAFLVNGNMAIAASGRGGVLVRVDPAESEEIVSHSPAHPFEMRGRLMTGWLRVDAEHVATKRQLEAWVRRGVTTAQVLPAKK